MTCFKVILGSLLILNLACSTVPVSTRDRSLHPISLDEIRQLVQERASVEKIEKQLGKADRIIPCEVLETKVKDICKESFESWDYLVGSGPDRELYPIATLTILRSTRSVAVGTWFPWADGHSLTLNDAFAKFSDSKFKKITEDRVIAHHQYTTDVSYVDEQSGITLEDIHHYRNTVSSIRISPLQTSVAKK